MNQENYKYEKAISEDSLELLKSLLAEEEDEVKEESKQKSMEEPKSQTEKDKSITESGQKETVSSTSETDSESEPKNLPQGTFLLGNYKVSVPNDALTNLNILSGLQKLASDCRDDYVKFYRHCGSLEKVISGTPSKVASYYEKMAEKVERTLLNNHVAGINTEELIEYNQYSYQAASVLKQMRNAKGKLDTAKNSEFAYREYRKNKRTKFVGGGFGLSGAVKGMAMAGAANMATGAVHSVFNVFGNAATKASYNSRMSALKDSGYCGQMASAIEADCLLFVDTLSAYLRKKTRIRLHYDMESISKSNQMIKQVEDGKVKKSAEMEILVKAFLTYPANERFYELFCYKYMDKEGELVRCMEYFGLDSGQVQLIHASRAYCDSYFGDPYIPLIKEKLQNDYLMLDAFIHYFYEEEVNPYLMEDINNVPHLFIKDSAEWMENSEYCMSFEDGKNIHHIYRIQRMTGFDIDLNKEVPLLFIRLEPFSMKSFILVTSKYVILPDVKLKIQLIDEVEVVSNAVVFCKKYSVKSGMFSGEMEQDDLRAVLLTVILYIQFAWNLNQKKKTIPLLGVYADNEMADPYEFLKEDYTSAMAEYGYPSQYIASLFHTQNWNLITTKNSVKNMQFIEKELKKYEVTLQQEKFVLMFISDGILEGKSGIYFTEQNMYYYTNKSTYRLPIESIKSFDYDEGKGQFIVNGSIIINVVMDKRANELADHFMQIVQLLQQNLILKEDSSTLDADDSSQHSGTEENDTKQEGKQNRDILEKIKKCCGAYKVSSAYDTDIAAGESVGPERIKKFDEVVRAFELEPAEEIFFFNNDSSLFAGFQGLLLCTSGMKIVSKRGKFFYGWEEFQKLSLHYSFFMDGLYINDKPVLPLKAEGKKTCKLLKDLQEILKSV